MTNHKTEDPFWPTALMLTLIVVVTLGVVLGIDGMLALGRMIIE